MRRILRILSSITLFASLLILLLTAILWLRSSTLIDYLQWTDNRHIPGLVSSDGRIIYTYQYFSGGAGGNNPGVAIGSRPGDPPFWQREAANSSRNYFAGFEWSPIAAAQPSIEFIDIPSPTTYLISIPHWFLCLLASIPTLLWLRNKWRHRNRDATLCPVCDYDLRATPHRCPECGTVIQS